MENTKTDRVESYQAEKSEGCFNIFRGFLRRNKQNDRAIRPRKEIKQGTTSRQDREIQFEMVRNEDVANQSVTRNMLGRCEFDIETELAREIEGLEHEKCQIRAEKRRIEKLQKEGKKWYKDKKLELERDSKEMKKRARLNGSKGKEQEKELKRDKEILKAMARDENKWHRAKLKEAKERKKEIDYELKGILAEQRKRQ